MKTFKTLNKGQILSYEQTLQIEVLSGELWVTIEKNPDDSVLNEGKHFIQSSGQKIVMEALENTTFTYSLQSQDWDKEGLQPGARSA